MTSTQTTEETRRDTVAWKFTPDMASGD